MEKIVQWATGPPRIYVHIYYSSRRSPETRSRDLGTIPLYSQEMVSEPGNATRLSLYLAAARLYSNAYGEYITALELNGCFS